LIGRWGSRDGDREVSVKIAMRDKSVQRGLLERIGVFFVLDNQGFCGAVEDQGFRPFL